MLSVVPDLAPLPWLETLQRVAALPTLDPIEWLIAAVASANDLGWPLTPELYEAIGRAYLDRLCAACALRINPARTRIVPPRVLVTGPASMSEPFTASPRPLTVTAPPKAPTITQVYEHWATFAPREAKLVDEWRTAVTRFARLHGHTAPMPSRYNSTCSDHRTLYEREPAETAHRVDHPLRSS